MTIGARPSEFGIQIADLKQLPGLKMTKMVMYSITLKLNSTFRTIGLATADKMTAFIWDFFLGYKIEMKFSAALLFSENNGML